VVIADGASQNRVENCSIHDTGHGEEGSGDCVVINGARDNTIISNRLHNGCHSQVLLLNGAQHNHIAGNDMYSTKRAWAGAGVNLVLGSDENIVAGNRIHDLGLITDQKCAIQIDTARNTIEHNVIYNVGAFGISPQSYAYGGKHQAAAHNVIRNNTIYRCGRQPLVVISKQEDRAAGNRFLDNIVVAPTRDWYGTPVWLMIFDTYHLTRPAEPGDWLGNTFEGNIFWNPSGS
jgi:hypothetical protein